MADALAVLADPRTTNAISLLTAFATVIYVAFTYKIYKANAAMVRSLLTQAEHERRPRIAAHVEIRAQVIFVLVVRNIGRSAA